MALYNDSYSKLRKFAQQAETVFYLQWEGRGYSMQWFQKDMQLIQAQLGEGPCYYMMYDVGVMFSKTPVAGEPAHEVEVVYVRQGQMSDDTWASTEFDMGAGTGHEQPMMAEYWTQMNALSDFAGVMQGLDPDQDYSMLADTATQVPHLPSDDMDGSGGIGGDAPLE